MIATLPDGSKRTYRLGEQLCGVQLVSVELRYEDIEAVQDPKWKEWFEDAILPRLAPRSWFHEPGT